MSGKIQQKALLGKHHLSQQHSLVITNTSNSSLYEHETESNLNFILKRFPHLDRTKVRNLLEQLENNRQIALQILEEEQAACNRILEEKRGDIKKPLNLSPSEENRILKRSFLNLYKKMTVILREKQELGRKMQQLRGENQKVKTMNRVLLEGEYNRDYLGSNTDIC